VSTNFNCHGYTHFIVMPLPSQQALKQCQAIDTSLCPFSLLHKYAKLQVFLIYY